MDKGGKEEKKNVYLDIKFKKKEKGTDRRSDAQYKLVLLKQG